MAFVQKVEKKSDLDDMMNEVQEKIQEKDAEFAVLLDNVISLNFKDTQTWKLRKLNWFVYALFTQEYEKSSYFVCNCLILSVDQPGLEPGTSRLWVYLQYISQNCK